MSGVAVEMGSVADKRVFDLDGDGVDDLDDHEYFLNFYDHALEIEGASNCNFTATAHEVAPSVVQGLINQTLIDPAFPDRSSKASR